MRPKTRTIFRAFSGIFLFSLAILPGCGGSGGGGSSSPSGEIVYALAEDTTANGYIVENGISPSGQLYSGAPAALTTNGTYPVTFVVDSNASLAFALNSNSLSDSSPSAGSIQAYNTSTAQTSSGIQPLTKTQTGLNPTDMVLDPGGNYLVVADHGSGTSSTPGDIMVFSIGSGGSLTSQPLTPSLPTSSCPNPDKVAFLPGATGTATDQFVVVCSSPELITKNTAPAPALFKCSLSEGCVPVTLPVFATGTYNAIVNIEISPSGTIFLPVENYSAGSYYAFLVTCPSSGGFCTASSSLGTSTAPAGDFAISNNTAYIGNYSPSGSGGFSKPGTFSSCSSTPTCSTLLQYSSSGAPTFIATNPNQTSLYIVSTSAPLPSPFSSSNINGSVYDCPLPSGTPSCTQTGTTEAYPVGITFDPSGNLAFVPTWSGTVSIFQVGSNGTLTSVSANPTINISGDLVLQVVVP